MKGFQRVQDKRLLRIFETPSTTIYMKGLIHMFPKLHHFQLKAAKYMWRRRLLFPSSSYDSDWQFLEKYTIQKLLLFLFFDKKIKNML